jgi:thioredoxin-related protein
VARLNILSEPGREAAQRYSIHAVPTFLVFDDDGTMIARQVGPPNRKEIEAVIARGRSQ